MAAGSKDLQTLSQAMPLNFVKPSADALLSQNLHHQSIHAVSVDISENIAQVVRSA